ncbi:MAG: hypothetical protein J6K17_14590 [Oscillospiraceae bacterium]|nr:hypothetical protein [Oscillospiraceae bacterium]
MNINLGLICQEEMNKIVQEGYIEAQIRASLEKTIKSAIEDEFEGYNGTVKKAVQAAVKESVQIDTEKIDVPLYNRYIVSVIKEVLDNYITLECKNKIKDSIEKILVQEIKPSYTLQEIINEFKSYYCDDKKYGDEMTLHIKKTTFGSWIIAMDEKQDVEFSDCDVSFRISDVLHTACNIKALGCEKDSDCISCYSFERFLHRIAANNSKIEVGDDLVEFYNLSYIEDEY